MEYLISIALVLLSGLFSGLTLGLLSLNLSELKRKINLGDKNAEKIYPIRKKGNLLLCTLLLGNVAVNTALSIFLGSIASGIIAGITATALIVIFGEIIPQAFCSRYAILVGAKTIWLVKIFILILYPIAFPLSLVLNKMLGSELPTIWSKNELREIIKFHEDSKDSELDADEERIMLGALSYSSKTVKDIMTPRTIMFTLEINSALDHKTIQGIKRHGFTRIPVYQNQIDNIIGILNVKDILGLEPGVKTAEVYRQNNITYVPETKKLDELMNELLKSRNHLAFVKDEFGSLMGIVTLEDIIEEVLKVEIVDETDNVTDLRKEAKKRSSEEIQ